MATGAAFNRAKSRQDYETPLDFISAVEARFGKLEVDLAARADNRRAEEFISPAEDSLLTDWPLDKFCWLNPPFANIAPWAKKCCESGAMVALLVPASVGALWFFEWVFGKAYVIFLQPRIAFDPQKPKDGFPKDCMLAIYGTKYRGFETWNWKVSESGVL